ncbi:hypothetical protein SG34_017345 [Thalassomonas viridans]|uniref:Peptidoglycan-binding protein, CsiV n=1 Tax=Thalassomonas viridans TaxID=137584 RepID=A0AAE9Z0Y5_9GAMM|nr:CsiV family protein [Thalassomonas viridans]WDE03173.1 hypothetical protein SG34_017345 [Thalassomonas viridans]
MKFNRALAMGSALVMSASALGANERWFEMEVILFSQLSDKSLLKEHFPDSQPLPKYKKVVDLLTPYLNPDIASLKQQLATCGGDQPAPDLISQAIENSRQQIFNPKTLEQIQATEYAPEQALTADFSASGLTIGDFPADEDSFNLDSSTNEAATGLPSDDGFAVERAGGNDTGLSRQPVSEVIASGEQPDAFPETDPGFSEAQRALVDLAEQEFSPIQLSYSPETFTRELCRLDAARFNEYRQAHGNYSLNGFTVTQMPLRIDGIEDEYSPKPYLLSRDSLKLRNIVTQLRRSKNFRPLLHLGWRQPAVSRRRAVPLRLFAGENLQAHYQSAHELYLQDMAESRAQEQVLAQTLAGQADVPGLTTEVMPEQDPAQIIRQRLNLQIQDILAQAGELDEPGENPSSLDETGSEISRGVSYALSDALSDASLIDELNKPLMPLEQDIEEFSEQLMLADAPEAPVQPWFLDGFFRVHLNHYLYITADFNIMNMSLAQQATQALASSGAGSQQSQPVKAINFKQNRRVISGEIHYFDHPYMGMIVQIRRYKRPEPPETKESE